MWFGETRIDDAEGLILAHSLRLPHTMMKKGRILSPTDVRALKAAGINFITGARPEAGDVGENDAAGMIAATLSGDGIAASPAFSGRCNLFAMRRGLLVYDRDRLDRLNLVDEAMTVAALPPYDIVGPRQQIATVKIIPFGVAKAMAETCCAYASHGGPLLHVRPFRAMTVALIHTTLPGLRENVLDSTAAVTRARVQAVDSQIGLEMRCSHDVGSLERTLAKAASQGCDLILVAGASATVDRRDVVPSAILKAGGGIDHFGMPVDPGNLMVLGHVGTIPVVNLPGCARAPKPNGLDWILRRIAAGILPQSKDIMRMGPGGLLKETGPRVGTLRGDSEPAGGFILSRNYPSRPPRIAAIILATGRESAAIAQMVETALSAALEPVVVVTGRDADQIEEALPACEVRIVRDPDWTKGQGASIKAGICALPLEVDAALLLSAEVPRFSMEQIMRLLTAFDPDEGRAVVIPTWAGQHRQAVLLDRDCFPEADDIDGDGLWVQLAQRHLDRCVEIEMTPPRNGASAVAAD